MSTDLGFVAHAPKRDTHELAAHRFGDRTSERRFADPRWTDKTENWSFALGLEFEHGKVFENSLFDFFQVVVIAFQNVASLDDVYFLGGENTPRKRHKPIKIRTRDRILGRGRRHAAQATYLTLRLFLSFFGHASGFDFLTEFFDFTLCVVTFA